MGIAQRRAAKALKRKAVVKAKQAVERASVGGSDYRWDSCSVLDVQIPKASAALIDIAEPLIERAHDREGYHKGLLLAMLAWNLSLLPVAQRKKETAEFFDDLAGRSDFGKEREARRSDFEEMIAYLISRKMLLHPFDTRRLENLNIVDIGDEYRVTVESLIDLAA
jgi:hypothetical protein